MSDEKRGAQLMFAALQELLAEQVREQVEPLMKEQMKQTQLIAQLLSHAKPANMVQPLGKAMTLKQLELEWKASAKTLRKKIKAGELRADFLHGKYVVRAEDWQTYLASSRPKARPAKRLDSVDIATRSDALFRKLNG